MSRLENVFESLENSRDLMTQFMVQLLRIKAVNPECGGSGEYARALFVQDWLTNLGLSVARHDISDNRVPDSVRVNLTSVIEGLDKSRTLWLATHLDTVPEGERELWNTDPYDPVVKDGRVFGRGAEDNGQGIVSALFALRALRTHDVKPPINVGIACLSDEEGSNEFGVIPLLKKGVFKSNDIAIVPDNGVSDGSVIEIAEKSILWLKLTVTGKQVHASTPEKGLNAHRIGMRFALLVDELLHSKYNSSDPLFEPPVSTFEPTKQESSVDNVNTVPGLDVEHFDCRVLPQYPLKDVLKDVELIKSSVEKDTGAKVEVTVVQSEENAGRTPYDSEVVQKLMIALKELRGVTAKPRGIGGGTFGMYFRRKGINTAVWSTVDDVAHQPNEYCKIQNLVDDAKVFAHVALKL